LYDRTGPFAWIGELYAIGAANLVSHFGPWEARPAATYVAGEAQAHRALVYIGSTYDEPLPAAFLDDVLRTDRPVLWMNYNVWQLAKAPEFAARYGFHPWQFRSEPVSEVRYKGVALGRSVETTDGIMGYDALDPAAVQVLATAITRDGQTFPWAVRSRNLTYVGEIPFAFMGEEDRYLALCDLLFGLLAPDAPERHRALVRIEDVHALTPPGKLRRIADQLASRGVPFSVAVIPTFFDPKRPGGTRRVTLDRAPGLVAALRYMLARGGTLVMHGDTHQYGNVPNPYNGASVADFEFYRAHLDGDDSVVLDGPVPEDSEEWARGRAEAGLAVFRTARLPAPDIFEYPHYAGSALDSRTLSAIFPAAYQRGMYFGGVLSGEEAGPKRSMGMFFPFVVKDVFGWKVLPENLGNYIPVGYNGNPSRNAEEILHAAQTHLVIRDGVASFFFHPMYDPAILGEIVDGMRTMGYAFTDPATLLREADAAH
jgi:uncharacterized protein YdaL